MPTLSLQAAELCVLGCWGSPRPCSASPSAFLGSRAHLLQLRLTLRQLGCLLHSLPLPPLSSAVRGQQYQRSEGKGGDWLPWEGVASCFGVSGAGRVCRQRVLAATYHCLPAFIPLQGPQSAQVAAPSLPAPVLLQLSQAFHWLRSRFRPRPAAPGARALRTSAHVSAALRFELGEAGVTELPIPSPGAKRVPGVCMCPSSTQQPLLCATLMV